MVKIVPKNFGKYLLLDLIGTGGMAEIFRAKMKGDQGFEKVIAVKKILPHLVHETNLVNAFISEARLAAFLAHENIVRTYDFGRMGDDYFLAMEYLFGKNLRLMINKAYEVMLPMSLVNTLFVISQVLIGLEYAHELTDFAGVPLDVVHRDISPQNIFVTYSGQVKVIDFGVAKAKSQVSSTRYGVIKGKLAYMSPEQASGSTVDHRTDIFAVGAILYELLTGHRLYNGETMEVLENARLARFIPASELMPQLPQRLLAILEKSLAREIEERYESCGQMLADIEDAIWELSFRPSMKGLARYMKELFKDELPEEESMLREMMGTQALESRQGEAAKQAPRKKPTRIKAQGPDALTVKNTFFLPADSKAVGILGSLGSGKTSIIRRYTENFFSEKHWPTACMMTQNKQVNFEGKNLVLKLWEYAGPDPVNGFVADTIKPLDGLLLVVDCTQASSLETAMQIYEALSSADSEIPFVCAVTKTDFSLNWAVERNKLSELEKQGWKIIRTSAKTGVGITRAMMTLVEQLLAKDGSRNKNEKALI